MNYQVVYDIASICAKKSATNVVLCPGSRCAPLTLAFTRHPELTCRTFSDERSAGFIALGMAQQLARPVIMLCTSGTAAYNFAPAVAEAFFSETPLIVFTADRPSEWIAQHDGQTIYQTGIFGGHVKKSFTLPQDYDHPDSLWAVNRIINEALNLANEEPKGPVHINAPFREPLYPTANEPAKFRDDVRIIDRLAARRQPDDYFKARITSDLSSFHRILVVVGQQKYDSGFQEQLGAFTLKHNIPVVGDITSNISELPQAITHADLFLGQIPREIKHTLRPDLLITTGNSLISKNLKIFLRQYPATAHWHIQESGTPTDPLQSLTRHIQIDPSVFFQLLTERPESVTFDQRKQENFSGLWNVAELKARRELTQYFPQAELNELELVHDVLQALPEKSHLHLANSMSVRYANFIGLPEETSQVSVWANRGTSGIDGSTSTAIGHALAAPDQLHILITGDLAFFYDRNAFWNKYPVDNLRVLLLNNHGGLIFNMIDGPASQPEAGEYFITEQRLNARKLCEEYQFIHLPLDSRKKLKNYLKDFFDDGATRIMELETALALNKSIFENLKLKIKEAYES